MFEDITIIDGGLSNQLEAQGHDLSDDLWSARLLLDDPGEVVAAHRAYVDAGAQVVITASYQVSFDGFARAGIDGDQTLQLLRLSVDLAREAAGDQALVAASIGPYGAALADGSEYRGRYGLSIDGLRTWHQRRLEVLVDAQPDLLAVETVPDVDEARAVLELLDGSGVPAWLTYTVTGGTTAAGQPLDDAFAVARDVDEVVAVGVNCSAPGDVLTAVQAASSASGLPVVVYPNSGEGWDAQARDWAGPATSIVDLADSWVAAGARGVGGCCRVGPDQIAALASRLLR